MGENQPTASGTPAMPACARGFLSVVSALAMLGLVGWIDYWSGYEISVFILYFLPIAWVTWSMNLAWGLALGVLGSAVWLWADIAAGHPYSHAWIAWEKGAMNVFIFFFIAFSFHIFKRNLQSKSRKVRQLKGILPICIACNRISNERGEWTDLDTYLREHSDAEPKTLLCPECSGARYR